MQLPSVTNIRLRLILLVLLGMLGTSGVLVFHAYIDRNRQVAELQGETARLSKLNAEAIQQVLGNTRKMLLSLAANESVSQMEGPAASTLLAEKLKQSPA